MIRTSRMLSVVTALVFAAVVGAPSIAQAAPVKATSVAEFNDAKAAVGATWQETLPTGQVVTMQKVAPGVSKSLTLVAKSLSQCAHPYLCMWSSSGYVGTFWRYNMNDVYSHTADGVAHCWNLASDANNNTKSWYNASNDRVARLNNWVNCNIATGGQFFGLIYGQFETCAGEPSWCTTYRVTSIWASS